MKYDQPSQEEKMEEDISLKAFLEENQDIISELKDSKQQLRYIIVGEDQKLATVEKQQGYYQEMVSLLMDEIALPLQQVEQEELISALAELEEENLSIVFGYPQMNNNVSSMLVNREESLVLVTTKKDMKRSEVPYFYWGTEEYLRSYIKDSILEDHTILFNSGSDLFEAFLQGEIEGMLIKKSTYEKYLQEGEELYLVSDMVFPIQEYILISSEEDVLSRFMKRFLSFYEKYIKEEQLSAIEVRYQEPKEGVKEKIVLWTTSIIIGLAFIIALFSIVIYHRKNKKKKQIASLLYQELSVIHHKGQEVLIVDLVTGKIRSSQNFSCLFENLKSFHRKNIKIKELSNKIGFNFEEHYRYICRRFERTYQFQYQLYLGGVRYLVKEEGIFEQGILVLLMSKEKIRE